MIDNFLKSSVQQEEKFCCGGINAEKTFLVIRPSTNCEEGLMALLIGVLKQIVYAEKKGFVPVVDFQNYMTQYRDIGISQLNVWEYYFLQLSSYSLEEVYKSKNVIVSGIQGYNESREIKKKFDSDTLNNARRVLKKWIHINEITYKKIEEEKRRLDLQNSVGLYLRGTDYLYVEREGHKKQPTVEQAINEVNKIMEMYSLNKVFLVTEDNNIYEKVLKIFKDKLNVVSYDRFIANYDYSSKEILFHQPEMINQLSDSPYERGLNYLCKILLLSECQVLVAGNTCGSWATCVFSEGFKKVVIIE